MPERHPSANNSADRVISVTRPALGNGEAAQVITTQHDAFGRAAILTQLDLPDGRLHEKQAKA